VSEKQGRTRTWIWFSVVRVGIFAAVLVVLLIVLPVPAWISTLLAGVIAFCLSIIFLARPRAELSRDLARVRRGERADPDAPTDDDAEDAAVDSGTDVRG
jgi:hypothetical protein